MTATAAVTVAVTVTVAAAGCHRGASDPSPAPFSLEESDSVFEQIDGNGDGRVDLASFRRGLTIHYYFRQGFDLDGDGIIDPVELTTALFELWDGDDDGVLSREELVAGLRVWFPDRGVVKLDEWDADGNGMLSVGEFGQGALSSNLYDAYDANGDGEIETEEVSKYLFSRWDTNDDGYVDREEWPLR